MGRRHTSGAPALHQRLTYVMLEGWPGSCRSSMISALSHAGHPLFPRMTVSDMAVAPTPRPATTVGHTWPSSEVLREHVPLVRLLTSIWTIPQVGKIGLTLGTHSVDLLVFTSEDSEEIEATISAAERVYRATACTNGFMLHIIP